MYIDLLNNAKHALNNDNWKQPTKVAWLRCLYRYIPCCCVYMEYIYIYVCVCVCVCVCVYVCTCVRVPIALDMETNLNGHHGNDGNDNIAIVLL